MQFDASSFMRNISPLHLEGAEQGAGLSIKLSDAAEIISHGWASQVLSERMEPLFIGQDSAVCWTASQQGQQVDNQILSMWLLQTGRDKSSFL